MRQSDIITGLGFFLMGFSFIAEIWENGITGFQLSNIEMILLGIILVILALIMKVGGLEKSSINNKEVG